MLGRDVIVIGGSAGAVAALKDLMPRLPTDLGASIFIAVHIGPHGLSFLPEILGKAGKLPVSWARDGEKHERGHVYVAPPDHHLLVDAGYLRIVRGPKENGTRPAVDPLFRSAAIAYGPRVIGVVLSGYLDDGAAGLLAIKDRGGIAIVQDPAEASVASMPESALASVPIDHKVSIRSMAETLIRYDPPEEQATPPLPPVLEVEHKLTAMEALLADRRELERVATPSPYSCPECGGILFRLKDLRLVRFRCAQAHGWSPLSLLSALSEMSERSLFSAARGMTEVVELTKEVTERMPSLADRPALLARPTALAREVRELQAFLTANGIGN
jgi:two-component system chemotaxis response regulator CheB